jgi:hypothetical protein
MNTFFVVHRKRGQAYGGASSAHNNKQRRSSGANSTTTAHGAEHHAATTTNKEASTVNQPTKTSLLQGGEDFIFDKTSSSRQQTMSASPVYEFHAPHWGVATPLTSDGEAKRGDVPGETTDTDEEEVCSLHLVDHHLK